MAMRIVLTNDDGFESSNLQALFTALRAAGHDVILSAPYRNVSGSSAQLGLLSDIPRTGAPSPGGLIPAGAPGVGPTGIAPNQYYVDSSPIAALLYGIDIAAPAKWGALPDLVISGPNAGNNYGVVVVHSGTVGAAVTAINRGVPAIAVSGANDDAAAAPKLAAIVLRAITAAVDDHGKIALPSGIGLNVNIPTLDSPRTAASYRFAFTQIGCGVNLGIRFALRNGDPPAPATVGPPNDNNPGSEPNAFDGNTVTVSPIQGTFQAPPAQTAQVLTQMRGLFATAVAIINPKLINISVRGLVGAGNAAQIAGFVITGTSAKTILFRAGGPALVAFGVAGTLADPLVELYDRDNRLIATNDNWSTDATKASAIAAAAVRVGAFAWAPGSKDAALLVSLAPGPYTVVVRGVGDTTGVALIEAYDADVD